MMMADTDGGFGPAILWISWVFAVVAGVIVILRYYIRLRVVRRFGIEDWLILLTFLLTLANAGLLTAGVRWGLGQHIYTLKPVNIKNSVKWAYLSSFFGIMSPGIGRISYAFLLLGIIPPTPWRRWILWSLIWLQLVVDCVTVILNYSQCFPIEGFWDRSLKANCRPQVIQARISFVQGAVCSLTDLVLAVFPASMFWKLNMEWKTKLSLSCLMGLGIFAMIASIIKTVMLHALGPGSDVTYVMGELALWWTVEAYLVLIAASIPTLKPIMKISKRGTRAEVTKKRGVVNSWVSSKLKLLSVTTSGGSQSIDEPELLNDASNNERPSYRVNVSPQQHVDGDENTIGIRMHTTASVTYEDRGRTDVENNSRTQPREW